jgi:hypothetical protein
MSIYKITNITNLAKKRDFKFNSELDIEYVDNMVKKTVKIKPGNSLYLTVSSLPLSVHRLRVKNLVLVSEISVTELAKLMKQSQSKTNIKTKIEEIKKIENFEESLKKSNKKKTIKK